MADAAIEIDGLSKTFTRGVFSKQRVHALVDVSFQVDRGAIFGLLGPNGAGKTTTVKCLLGIVRRSKGQAAIFGRPVQFGAARRNVGYLPEKLRFPKHHTGRTALEYYGGLSGLAPSEVRRRLPALIEQVGLQGWERTPVQRYSKGMQQRLGMAQAMLHEPELLFLDEPTDGVDPVGRREIRNILRMLKDQGKTVFLNSHLLQEVEQICDRVVILHQGRVRREGDMAELTRVDQAEFTFTVASSAEALEAALSPARILEVEPLPAGRSCGRVVLKGQAEIDACVDRIRAAGLSIVSMSGVRRSLEDAFMEVVGQSAPPVAMAPRPHGDPSSAAPSPGAAPPQGADPLPPLAQTPKAFPPRQSGAESGPSPPQGPAGEPPA